MKMGEWEDAERDLQEALGKDAKDADTLANLITVCVSEGFCLWVWRRGRGGNLQEALGKDAIDADTLANLITVGVLV
jgi:hypothetical protein